MVVTRTVPATIEPKRHDVLVTRMSGLLSNRPMIYWTPRATPTETRGCPARPGTVSDGRVRAVEALCPCVLSAPES